MSNRSGTGPVMQVRRRMNRKCTEHIGYGWECHTCHTMGPLVDDVDTALAGLEGHNGSQACLDRAAFFEATFGPF